MSNHYIVHFNYTKFKIIASKHVYKSQSTGILMSNFTALADLSETGTFIIDVVFSPSKSLHIRTPPILLCPTHHSITKYWN